MARYFRTWEQHRDPAELLDPANHVSSPWGSPRHGVCDKCAGTGTCEYRCASCAAGGADTGCPACRGRCEWRDTCPACEGTGGISRTHRDGVSAFPTQAGLERYLAERQADLEGCAVVEFEGETTGDRDIDADAGAVLVRPRAIVGLRPFSAAAR